jgi:hypothetical protein
MYSVCILHQLFPAFFREALLTRSDVTLGTLDLVTIFLNFNNSVIQYV